jgi:hypothetical protein
MTTKTQATQPSAVSEMRVEVMETTARLQGDGNEGQLQAPAGKEEGL